MAKTDTPQGGQTRDEGQLYTPTYRNYVLVILFIGYVVNVMDRNVFSASVESIRLEFGLSDTNMGLLGGLAFAFFYGTMGIPIARLADRWNRRNVLAISIGLWSVMTALVGSTVGFLTLLATRIGVGVGEAGGSPPSHSMISDYFPSKQRATALSVYALGVPIGIALGNFLGGLGNTALGWRMTFLLVGAPGVALAALVYFTIKEPPRGHSDRLSPRAGSADAPPMMEVALLLWKRTAFRHMCLGAALHASVWYGGSLWNNAYFQRTHDMTAAEAGSWIGGFALIGMIGTFFGGYLCDKLSIRYNDQRWYMWLPGIATLLILPFAAIAYLGPNMNWIAPAFSIKVILASVFFGPSFSVTQSIATLRTRAVATSLLLFTQTLIGLGLGPLFVGYISDYLEPTVGTRSLSYALAIMALTNVWAACHYFWGARTLRADLAATARMNEEAAG